MRLSIAITLLFLAGMASAAAPVAAATVNLNPVSDAFVSSANAANNYGGGGALAVSAAGLSKGEFQTLLQFDLSSAKSSFDTTFGAGMWVVESINLQLTAATPNNAIFNSPSAAGDLLASWMQNDSWVEGAGTPMAPGGTGVTFNSLPSFLSPGDQALGTFAFSGATSGSFTMSLALPSGLLSDIGAGQLASLQVAAADDMVAARFNSRSFMTETSRPILAVTAVAVPEPAAWAIAMVGFGLLPLVGVCKPRWSRQLSTKEVVCSR